MGFTKFIDLSMHNTNYNLLNVTNIKQTLMKYLYIAKIQKFKYHSFLLLNGPSQKNITA